MYCVHLLSTAKIHEKAMQLEMSIKKASPDKQMNNNGTPTAANNNSTDDGNMQIKVRRVYRADILVPRGVLAEIIAPQCVLSRNTCTSM